MNKANEVDNKVDMVNKRVSALETALLRSQNEQKKLHDKNLQLELYSHRDNLRLEGIPEQSGEKCLDLICEILSDMGLDPSNIQIARSHRLGAYQPKRKNAKANYI